MGPLRYLQSVFLLSACASLQAALGRVTDAANNLGIIGGHSIHIEDAPYMAGVFAFDVCVGAGTIVHESFILTSADCAASRPITEVHVGSSKKDENGQFLLIDYKVCHEETNENNICLLKLFDSLQFSIYVFKVHLPEENYKIQTGAKGYITGWGSKDAEGYLRSETLLQAEITVKSDEECRRAYHFMHELLLCAEGQERDAGKGDAGAPLTINNVQVGIMSFKLSRSPELTYYTRVSKYTSWIRTTINQNS